MNSVARIRFKYLLGELLVADWRPPLVVIDPPTGNAEAWPALEDVAPQGLPADAVGYVCHRVAPRRFPIGISCFGPWLCYVPRRERLYFVDLSGTFEQYLTRRSSKSRYNLKRSVKKVFDRNPGCVLEIFTAPEAIATFQREAVGVSLQTYQGQLLQVGLRDDAETLAAMQDTARRGGARGYLLRDQGKVIAFAWCSGRGTDLTYDVIGYLPEHAGTSPGTVLLYLILQDLFHLNHFSRLDFGVGEAPYKSAFATGYLDFADAFLFRPTWSHRLLVSLHMRLDQFSEKVGAYLERAGMKRYVKMLIRRLRNQTAAKGGKAGQ